MNFRREGLGCLTAVSQGFLAQGLAGGGTLNEYLLSEWTKV